MENTSIGMRKITQKEYLEASKAMEFIRSHYERFIKYDEYLVSILGEDSGEWISEELNNRTYSIDNLLKNCKIEVDK